MKISEVGAPRRYKCFTKDQQEFYDNLSPKRRKYVDLRGQGMSKIQAYKTVGYSGNNAGQAAYLLEERNSGIKELINTITQASFGGGQNLPAKRENANIQEIVKNADGETAKRIQFYNDIIDGKIKTVKRITRRRANGSIIDYKVEEVSDVEVRMRARQELDKILGLNAIFDVDKVQMGDITINIVDASKKDEIEDSRNNIVLDLDKVEEIDGEAVVVTEDKNETVKEEVVAEDVKE